MTDVKFSALDAQPSASAPGLALPTRALREFGGGNEWDREKERLARPIDYNGGERCAACMRDGCT